MSTEHEDRSDCWCNPTVGWPGHPLGLVHRSTPAAPSCTCAAEYLVCPVHPNAPWGPGSTPAASGLPWADGPCPECGRSDEHAAPCHAQTTLRCPHIGENAPCGERGHEGCCRSTPAAPRWGYGMVQDTDGLFVPDWATDTAKAERGESPAAPQWTRATAKGTAIGVDEWDRPLYVRATPAAPKEDDRE